MKTSVKGTFSHHFLAICSIVQSKWFTGYLTTFFRELGSRKLFKFYHYFFEIIFPGPDRDQNNLPHMKTLVELNGIYSYIIGFNQNNLLVTWPHFKGTGKTKSVLYLSALHGKVSSYLQSDWKIADRNFGYFSATDWCDRSCLDPTWNSCPWRIGKGLESHS